MKIIFTLLFCFFICVQSLFSQWQQTNGPRGGFVSCADNNEEEIFVGTQYGGVFRSTDNGASWSDRKNGLPEYGINCIAVDGDHLYVGPNMGGVSFYHSEDDGMTWELFENLWTSYVPNCIDAQGDKIYVGTAGGGVFCSNDGGDTWTSSFVGIVPYPYYSTIAIKIFGDDVFIDINGIVYRSEDDGATWENLDDNFPANTSISQLFELGSSLVVNTSSGLYLSEDGVSWDQMVPNLPLDGYGYSYFAKGNFLYAIGNGSGEIYFSIDNGQTWNDVNVSWPTGNAGFYVLSDGEILIQSGIYSSDWLTMQEPQLHYSDNNGMAWTTVTHEITSTYCLSLEAHDNSIFTGTNATGMFRTSDGGDSWENITGLNWHIRCMSVFDNTILAAGDGGIMRSIDNGDTWTVCNAGLQNSSVQGFARVNTDIFTATAAGVFVSTDDGQTWSLSNNGIADEYVMEIIAVGDILYSGSQTGVYTSDNFGNSWTNINGNIPFSTVYEMTYLNGALIVTGGNPGWIQMSTDNGQTWTDMNLAGSTGAPTSFAVFEEKLFVSTIGMYNLPGAGVYWTDDMGVTWHEGNEGLDNQKVFEILVHDGWLYAATLGSGVYKRPLSDFTTSVGETTSITMSVYPNPASDYVVLDIPAAFLGNDVIIKDAQGKEVLRKKNAGSSRVQLAVSSLASGVYFICVGEGVVRMVRQ